MTEGELARLVENPGAAPEFDAAWRHLHSCSRCFEAFRDSALYRKLWEAGEGRFEHDERLLAAARAIATEDGRTGDRRLRHGSTRTPGLKRSVIVTAAIACAAVVVAFSMWLLNTTPEGTASVAVEDAAALVQVRHAVEMASLQGPFIYPGTENMKIVEAPVYRSAHVPLTDSLQTALSRLFDKYQRGDASADEAYWLAAGYVATGNLRLAEDLMSEMRQRPPLDTRFLVVSAIVAADKGDTALAVDVLNQALRESLQDSAALMNLQRLTAR